MDFQIEKLDFLESDKISDLNKVQFNILFML